MPLSTTSYFFASIDDLVAEALRTNVAGFIDTFDAAEKAWVLNEGENTDELVGHIIEALLDGPDTRKASQIELFLAAGRDPELGAELSVAVERMAERTAWQVERYGGHRPVDIGWALLALVDGAMLHRVAGVETDHRERLHKGLRLLFAAAMLDDDEIQGLLDRLNATTRSLATPDQPSVASSADPAATA